MKLIIVLFIVSAFVVLSEGCVLPVTVTTPADNVTTTPSPTTMPPPQDLVSTMSTSTHLSPPLYILTAKDNLTVKDCFYRRIWNRTDESDLPPAQLFCKRLAANSPNEEETFPRDPLNKFASFRSKWDQLVEDKPHDIPLYYDAINLLRRDLYYAPNYINATAEEKAEIQNCYFYRAWKSIPEANLTAHESFCLRLDTYKPDLIEVQGFFQFITFDHIYDTMADAALSDFANTVTCLRYKERPDVTPDEICQAFNKRIESPTTWRDIRIKEVHDCMLANNQAPNGPRKNLCLDVIRDYQRVYFRTP